MLCRNIAAFLSAPDVNLKDVQEQTKLTESEIGRAKEGIIIRLESQRRILTYFGVDLALAGRENLHARLNKS
jgi:hypothetical protein